MSKYIRGKDWIKIEKELRELNKGRDPWDILENERIEDYRLFCLYRELSPKERKIQKVAELTNIPVGTIGRISWQNKWRERAFLYDFHLDRLRMQIRENAITGISLIAQEAIEKLLRIFISKVETASLNEIPLDMIDKLINAAIKFQEAILDNRRLGKLFEPEGKETEDIDIEVEEIDVEGEDYEDTAEVTFKAEEGMGKR